MEIEKEEREYLEEIVQDINLFICRLYDIAAERGTGKFDIYGNIYLENIPFELLCEVLISAINVKKLKNTMENICKLYIEDDEKYSIEFIKSEIKKILLLYFVVEDFERQEDGEQKKYIKLMGRMENEEDRRMSSFQVVSFYKYIYEFYKLPESLPVKDRPKEFRKRYLDIPYRVNKYLLEKKKCRECELYSARDAEIWRREMREFLDTELGEERKQRYFEDMELDRIERSIPYLTKES